MKKKIKRVLFLGFILLLLGSFVYCGGGGGGGENKGPNTGPADMPGQASTFIKADQGGNVSAADGTGVYIPPHALPQDATVTVVPVRVENLSGQYMTGVRFEPDGLVLARPAICYLALPSYWDGDERPSICGFDGRDPGNASCDGLYVDIVGSQGAYKAKFEVLHFSGGVAAGKPAANCHEGTLEYLLKKFAARGCNRNQALDKVIQNYRNQHNVQLQFSWGDAAKDWETPVQAFLETYFIELPTPGQIDQNFLDEIKQNYLNPGVDENYRYEVVLAFGGNGGQWESNEEGALQNFKHTGVLTYVNGKLKLRNSASARKEIIDALVEENGENVYFYPSGNEELNAQNLQILRELKTGGPLELALGNELGCLSDKSKNYLNNGEGIAPFKPYDQRVKPWRAMKIYIAKIRNDVNPCTGIQQGSRGTIRTTVDVAYYVGEAKQQYQTDFSAAEIYPYVYPGVGEVQVTGKSNSGDELFFTLKGDLSPGMYSSATGLAHLVFTSPQIRHQNDNQMVDIIAESGGLYLETFQNFYGGIAKGYFFDVAIAGGQITPDGTAIRVITGKMPRVDFDIILAESQIPPT